MYLGTITSVMTKNLYEQPEFEVAGKRVIGLFIPIKFSLLICFLAIVSTARGMKKGWMNG